MKVPLIKKNIQPYKFNKIYLEFVPHGIVSNSIKTILN